MATPRYFDEDGNEVIPTRARPNVLINRIIWFVLIATLVLVWALAGPAMWSHYVTGQPSMASVPTSALALLIPSSNPPALPRQNPGGSYNNPADAQQAYAAAVEKAAPTAAPTERPCVLTTWQDGSQGCDDGRVIDAAHSKPGYCTPVVWQDGSVGCNDGKKAGKVVWPDPELADDPTVTPWPAAPTGDVQWSSAPGPSANTCVTVTFADAHTQTACSDPHVTLDQDDAGFVARMIQDGKIAPGVGAPKG